MLKVGTIKKELIKIRDYPDLNLEEHQVLKTKLTKAHNVSKFLITNKLDALALLAMPLNTLNTLQEIIEKTKDLKRDELVNLLRTINLIKQLNEFQKSTVIALVKKSFLGKELKDLTSAESAALEIHVQETMQKENPHIEFPKTNKKNINPNSVLGLILGKPASKK